MTDKNEKQFKIWLLNTTIFIALSGMGDQMTYDDFINSDFLLQTGVYLDYYDSLEIYINTSIAPDGDCSYSMIYDDSHAECFSFDDRPAAFKIAFKEANTIVNNRKL